MTTLEAPPPPVVDDEVPSPAPVRLAGTARAWAWFAERRWPTFVVFAVLGLAATATSSPGAYIGDSRYEIYANPARRLAKGFAIWDASRGLGRVREDLWVGVNAPLALLRVVGLDAAWTERVWHALLLALVATGVVAVLSLFRPRLGPEHLVAGFSAAFGVYSLAFLTPFSDIYLQFALAPWLLVVFTRGVTDPRPWRWAAAFALLVALPGNVDVPGLVLAAVPLLPLAVYLVLVERRVRLGHLFGWVARAGALTVLVSAAVLAKLYLASGIFGQRLNDTEAVDVSFRASSWTESWRGLGNWLSYFRDGAQLLKPQGGVYFSSALVVLCTLVPAMVALAYVWLSRWRPRLLFALMALTSLVLLVGAYPLANPSPAGSRLLTALKDVALLGAFRNVYKAGPGLVIGVSILFGCGAAAAVRRLRGRSPGGAVVVATVVVVVLAVNALPFWTGSVYNPNQRLDGVPAYWSDATAWLDAQPGDERVLVAPMTSRSRYRWGWVGDDILDSMLARPHAVATGVPLSTPQAANLLEQVSMGLSDPAYQPGSLAPVLRRLGVRYVLLRNDLDWQALGRPRPAAFDGLRNDPDLVPAASFGAPGTNTVDPTDRSDVAVRERALPPVEVLELRDPGPPDGVRVTDGRPPAVVSGDGAAWPELASLGALDGDRPVVYSGALEPSELQDLLRQGAPLYITDTNRRRLRVLLGYEPDSSATLAEGQNLDRVPQSLFGRPGSQSVAWYPDAETIYESGVPVRSASGSTPWNRPANAFDGNPATEWKVTQSEVQTAGPTLHVDLRPTPTHGARPSIRRSAAWASTSVPSPSCGCGSPTARRSSSPATTRSPRRANLARCASRRRSTPGR
ncbi:MAG: alpha-(1-_3)-arabinofuranosyltransferase family protein [Acidimicrobiales bacterium]